MRRHQGDDREGHHAHARHRGRVRRRASGRRVGLAIPGLEPIAFAGGALDRAAHLRSDEAWLAGALGSGEARAVVVGRDGALPELVSLAPDDRDPIFLGSDAAGAPLFAVRRPDADVVGLREIAATVPGDRVGLIAYATALVNWAGATRFCGRCGSATRPREGGHLRVCGNGHQHHPRTDPVVIMLVVDGDRALLGRQASWPRGRYSALAGFVEPGEPLEGAVAREVREEAGVEVGEVRYVASQPWPFPVSLMLGFEADYAGGEPAVGDAELEDVRWFSRDEIAAATRDEVAWIDGPDSDRLLVPPPIAIARLLVDRWLER